MQTLCKLITLVIILCAFSSCSSKVDENFKKILSKADRAIVYLYIDNDEGEPYDKIKELSKSNLAQLSNLLTKQAVPKDQSCGYDGAIFFYNESQLILKMRFNLQDSCSFAMYVENGELFTRRLSSNGQEILKNQLVADKTISPLSIY